MDFNNIYNNYRSQIDAALQNLFSERGFPYDGLLGAMRYSLLAGGKRLRPVLVLEFCRLCGGDTDKALPAALSTELLHTYSLIHDDLPCMDDDDLRRGKPSCHKVYGECAAVLAGDALQAEAFGLILGSDLPAPNRAACAGHLAAAAGVDGICGGQFMDMTLQPRNATDELIFDLCGRKTAALLSCACMMGVSAATGFARSPQYDEIINAGRGGERRDTDDAAYSYDPETARLEKQLEDAGRYGACLGLAFQARDDMLDALGDETALGKPVGSDAKQGKRTIFDAFDRDGKKCEDFIKKLSAAAKEILTDTFGGEDTAFLAALTDYLAYRDD